MNAYKIVLDTLNHHYPERVARSFRESDIVFARYAPSDRATEWDEVSTNRWERVDEWGNIWARMDKTSKGEVERGALVQLKDLDNYDFPDYSNPNCYQRVKEHRRSHPDQWLIGELPGFAFGIARKLRRMDYYLMDLITGPQKIRKLHDRIDNLLKDMIYNYALAGVDGVMLWEDWGTQDRLLINPALWKEEFLPRYKHLCRVAHDMNMKVFMHSCGQIKPIIQHLIEAGIDVLQLDQPDLIGIDDLALFQDQRRVTFWCPVDIQQTLQTKDESIIRIKAREMLDKLWKGRGGFIAGFYKDNTSLGLAEKWQAFACDEFIRYGIQDHYLTKTGTQR